MNFKFLALLPVVALFGCGEPTYEECVREAVKDGKSNYGITVLIAVCDQEYKAIHPTAAARAEEAANPPGTEAAADAAVGAEPAANGSTADAAVAKHSDDAGDAGY